MKALIIAGIALAAGLSPASAMAYGYYTCWGTKIKWKAETAQLRHSAVSFPEGSSYRTASADTIDKANQNPSEFRFTRSWGDGSVGINNGQNEVWFTNSDFGAPAQAVYQYAGLFFCNDPRLAEVDMRFDAGESYTSGTTLSTLWGYGGTKRPYRTTYMHEMGHAMGLAHENSRYNIMGEDWTHIHADNGVGRAYVGEDASNGLVFLYGTVSGAHEDLSVTHWEYKEADGEYSEHKRCGMRTQGGSLLPTFWNNGEEVRRVKRGQTVQVEFTYENNGKATHTVDVGFYLSTDDDIQSIDPRIGGWVAQLARDTVLTTTRNVTIPANAPLGYNWLGVIVDENDDVVEITGANNATYHRVFVEN